MNKRAVRKQARMKRKMDEHSQIIAKMKYLWRWSDKAFALSTKKVRK